MSKIKLTGHASGSGVLTVTAPNTSTDRTITLPDATGTLLNSDGDGSNLTGINLNAVTGNLTVSGNITGGNNGSIFLLDNAGQKSGEIQTDSSAANALQIDADPDNSASGSYTAFRVDNTERMRITPDGLTFNGDTAAANALDDYEEGTWTPTLTGSIAGSYTLDGGSNLLAYTKIGRVVHISGYINITNRNSENGNLRLTLPFTSFNGTDDTDYAFGNGMLANHGGNIPNGIHMFVTNNSSYVYMYNIADNGTASYIDHSDTDSAFQIGFSMTYIAA